MNLQFVKVNYEWQMKWIKRSYGFKISNGYDEDEEFNEGLDLWICKDSKIRKFIAANILVLIKIVHRQLII